MMEDCMMTDAEELQKMQDEWEAYQIDYGMEEEAFRKMEDYYGR
jgi:hypothetical protein